MVTQLGGMSGLELRDRLVAVQNETPVIFITAHDEPEVRAEAKASACAGYFRKTDPGAEVLAAIRRAVGLEEPDEDSKSRGATTSNQ